MNQSKLTDFRKSLHQNPELSGYEVETQSRIKQFIKAKTKLEGKNVGQFGTLYSFDFAPGKKVLIRVDCDALPIQEINDFSHKSKVDGVSHKCGHDGHTTIGAGLVMKLHNEPLSAGSVDVIFQPAEEIGEGAKGILADANFDISRYDYAVALHNIPGKPLHQVLYKKDGFTPAVQSLIVKLTGKTAHAAQPLTGHNPSYAIAEITQWALENEQTDEKHPNYHLITPVFTEIGSRDYGISAGYGEVHFTIRSWEQSKMESVTEAFLTKVKSIAAAHKLELAHEFTAVFAANQNNHFVVDQILQSAKDLGLNHSEKAEPFPWGEDFGLFTQTIPGAMFGLGSGENTPALHNPDYDYPDEITETGINLFYAIAQLIVES
ncbi:MAG: amidohydrolase [Salibacteraceae bacterium]|nr:amidohydrolase [Salibacteraceae bacterium]MDP4964704.1 amidohydrolase [Salibacteraceae bacterium]